MFDFVDVLMVIVIAIYVFGAYMIVCAIEEHFNDRWEPDDPDSFPHWNIIYHIWDWQNRREADKWVEIADGLWIAKEDAHLYKKDEEE